MHLTPEQIDRHPFRMARRGYDIVQVRDFLREIATEMRERQQVRERLAAAESQTQVDDGEIVARAEARAAEILADAERAAEELVEGAEVRARERSDVVLSEAQTRLDGLLAEEQNVKARLDTARPSSVSTLVGRSSVDADALVDVRDRGAGGGAPDTALADFMKSTLRDEANPS